MTGVRNGRHPLTPIPDRRAGFIEFCLNNPNFVIPAMTTSSYLPWTPQADESNAL